MVTPWSDIVFNKPTLKIVECDVSIQAHSLPGIHHGVREYRVE